ncbi:MAG: DUF4097 family beta strand repeat-containing protein [Planctomycetota bacterium]
MKRNYWTILALGICLCPLLIAVGCDIHIGGDWGQAKCERTVRQQTPLAAGSTVVAETSLGSVTIVGADVTDCNVVAVICGRASTEEQARELAEQVKIELEKVGDRLTVKAEKPPRKRNTSIGISYTITVPKQTNIECASSYGAIKLSNINGSVSGKTSSGSISAENIEGTVDLDTSYGSVTCKNVAGDNIKVKSSSGSITVERARGSVQLNTSYGEITCKDISDGDIILKTSSGKIRLSNASFGHCDAQTSYGSIASENLKGKSLKLHSDSGSINVTNATADAADISTSYGRITGRQIATAELIAKSGSGNIDIDCSDSAPAEIVADLITSYGSVDFRSPRDFSGRVDLSTSYGSIRTDLPITISGQISKKKLNGTIGQGKGKLNLRTSSGSINLK